MTCPHTISGCGYPQGECSGACLAAAPQYLTIVYQIHSTGQAQALLHATEWTAMSHSHAILDRDAAIKQRDALQSELIDTQLQHRDVRAAIEKLSGELEKVFQQLDEYAEAILALVDCVDNDCMPVGWSMDRARALAQKIRRCSNDRAVRRSHDEQYIAHDVEATRTGRVA